MENLKCLTVAKIHMNAAGQARVEAPHGAHDVNPFKFVWSVLFKDRRVLHGIFIRTRRAVYVPHATIPWGRRVRMVVGNLTIADHDMMR